MSLAIQITTHASEEDVNAQLAAIKKIADALDKAAPEDTPPAQVRVFGNDYSDPARPVKGIDRRIER